MSATAVTVIERHKIVQINEAHRAVEKAAGETLAHARDCGGMLAVVKLDLQHGAWIGWLEENFDGSVRTAQLYMQLADADPELLNAQPVADLSIRAAAQAIAKPRPTPVARVERQELDDLMDAQNFDQDPTPAPSDDTGVTRARASEVADRQARKLRRVRTLYDEVGEQIARLETEELSNWARREQASNAGVHARHLIAALDDLALSYEQ